MLEFVSGVTSLRAEVSLRRIFRMFRGVTPFVTLLARSGWLVHRHKAQLWAFALVWVQNGTPGETCARLWVMSTWGHIGRRIRQAREERGVSLRDLAERLGPSHITIREWQKGIRSVQFPDLERLAKPLEEPVQSFLPEWFIDPRNLSPDLAALVS